VIVILLLFKPHPVDWYGMIWSCSRVGGSKTVAGDNVTQSVTVSVFRHGGDWSELSWCEAC